MPIKVLAMTTEMSPTGVPNLLLSYLELLREHNRTAPAEAQIQMDIVNNDHTRSELEPQAEKLGAKVYHIAKAANVREFSREFTELVKNYDIFHSHFEAQSFLPLWLAQSAGVKKRIVTAHNLYNLHFHSLHEAYAKLTMKLIPRVATDLIGTSELAAESLFGSSWRKLKGKTAQVLPNPIREEGRYLRFSKTARGEVRDELGVAEDERLLVQVGMLTERKNPLFSAEVARKMGESGRKVKLLLVGDGPLREEIRRQYPEVIMVGDREDVGKFLSAADVFLMPSTYEGFGLSAVEAQASGLRCIVSPAIAPEAVLFPEMVEQLPIEGSGAVEAWAKACEKCAKNSVEYNCREKSFERFAQSTLSPQNVTERLVELYSLPPATCAQG